MSLRPGALFHDSETIGARSGLSFRPDTANAGSVLAGHRLAVSTVEACSS
jgi:hypothetical protein